MNIKYKKLLFFISVIILLTFLKIDFRFVDSIYCCSDDFDYFIHAESISEDLDFDYSNQLKGLEDKRYNNDSKVAPIGYVGTGILSAPFMFIGNSMDFLRENLFRSNSLMNYKLLVYSFSSIFYLFASFVLLFKILKILNIDIKNLEFLILFLGSGVIYYAFERYSMTHSYETFSTSLVIYFSTIFYKRKNSNLAAFFIPVATVIGLLVKWTNYYLLVIPFFMKLLIGSRKKLILNKQFLISVVASILSFLALSYQVYGLVTIDPRISYQVQSTVVEIVNTNLIENHLFTYFERIFIMFTTQEFGIIYFMPVMAASIIISFFLLFKNIIKTKKIDFIQITFLIASFQVILIVAIWRSTASSYGFRYLMGFYPLAIIYYYYLKEKYNFINFHKLLLFLSFFSILSVLFFETTVDSQLSVERIYNSFGKFTRYTQPQYLSGLWSSFFVFDSYLKIFTTSFFGSIIFKILLLFLGKLQFLNLLSSFGLPTDNNDFIIYINNLEKIGFDKFFLTIFFFIAIVLYINKLFINNKNQI
jgi:hypothetical protein